MDKLVIATQADYYVPLLRLLADYVDGAATAQKAVSDFYDRYGSSISAAHFEPLESTPDEEKWSNYVAWARKVLKDLGYLEMPRQGIWKISETGREWLATHPSATHLEGHKSRGPRSTARTVPPPQSQTPTPLGITLSMLESTRQLMPAEDFRSTWGELYDKLLAEQRALSITPIERTKLMALIIEQIYRIQGYIRGQGNERPSSEELCDWIYQCYLYGFHLEVAVLWPLVDKDQVELWYFERTMRIVLACRAKMPG